LFPHGRRHQPARGDPWTGQTKPTPSDRARGRGRLIKPAGPRRTRTREHDPPEAANDETRFAPLSPRFRRRFPAISAIPPPQISPRRWGSVTPTRCEALRSRLSSRGATLRGFRHPWFPMYVIFALPPILRLLRSWSGNGNRYDW